MRLILIGSFAHMPLLNALHAAVARAGLAALEIKRVEEQLDAELADQIVHCATMDDAFAMMARREEAAIAGLDAAILTLSNSTSYLPDISIEPTFQGRPWLAALERSGTHGRFPSPAVFKPP